jgi:F-type H+-transporting ATPase subunit epsilon
VAEESAYDVQLVTPERVLLSGPATEVILRTGEGDITFLAGYAPMVGSVEPGVLRLVRPEGDVVRVATHGGFVQVEKGMPQREGGAGSEGPGSGKAELGTRVTLLIGVAELADEIDLERARAALERAEARLAELGGLGGAGARGAEEGSGPDRELAEAQAAVRRAEVRIEATETATSGMTG